MAVCAPGVDDHALDQRVQFLAVVQIQAFILLFGFLKNRRAAVSDGRFGHVRLVDQLGRPFVVSCGTTQVLALAYTPLISG